MTDDEIFTRHGAGRGLVVSTGILGDLCCPPAPSIRGTPTRSATAPPRPQFTLPRPRTGYTAGIPLASRQYDAWCIRLCLPTLSADPRLVGIT